MQDDALIQLAWDRKCASAPACSCCGRSVYAFDTYTKLGDFLFCQRCMKYRDELYSCDLDLPE